MWFNKTIESEIKIRKMYNRQKRVEEDKQKKNIREEKYRVQKRKTQYMIKKAITAHERNITTDIRNNKGHKKLWDIVNTLRRKKRNTDKEEYIYIYIYVYTSPYVTCRVAFCYLACNIRRRFVYLQYGTYGCFEGTNGYN